MSDTVIKVEGLTKKYRIGLKQKPHDTLRDSISDFIGSRFHRLTGKGVEGEAEDIIYALKDVSFNVNQGEVVGIIGSNGAGKTTLLKILSRITEPTSGKVELKGRVASLIAVGTGFHPELTGRENIFLNGAILGMTKHEIKAKFSEVVEFSGIEKFIDTPVKRYSNGMYVRLAFSVAAHLDPEILLVDEVLAVGDIEFQKKCLGKMDDASKSGRTVLFVSHNMKVIESLCDCCILLEDGNIIDEGNSQSVISKYIMNISKSDKSLEGKGCLMVNKHVIKKYNKNGFVLNSIRVVTGSGEDVLFARTNESITLQITFSAEKVFYNVAFVVRIYTTLGVELIRLSTMPISGYPIQKLYGNRTIELKIKDIPLTADTYILDIAFAQPFKKAISEYKSVAFLTISANKTYPGEILMDSSRGYIVAQHEWRLL